MNGYIAELNDIANIIDDFRCFFEHHEDEANCEVEITDEATKSEEVVNRLDLIIEHMKSEERER